MKSIKILLAIVAFAFVACGEEKSYVDDTIKATDILRLTSTNSADSPYQYTIYPEINSVVTWSSSTYTIDDLDMYDFENSSVDTVYNFSFKIADTAIEQNEEGVEVEVDIEYVYTFATYEDAAQQDEGGFLGTLEVATTTDTLTYEMQVFEEVKWIEIP